MIKLNQLQELIQHVLKEVDLYSIDAEYLLIGTAAQESALGCFLRQFGSGPALGIFQMEPATEDDLWTNYLKYRPRLSEKIIKLFHGVSKNDLWWNLGYQVVMARLQYYRRPEPLPDHQDVQGMAKYWKKHYNTTAGQGTVKEFVKNFHAFCGELV